MAYITEQKLSNVLDLPIALPATNLKIGDWVVVAVTKLVVPMRLTYTVANLQLLTASVDVADITAGNKIFGNLGLVYLTMRLNYGSGTPGAAGGLDVLVADSLGTFTRDTSAPVVTIAPGLYSWIVANNMRASTDTVPVIPTSTSIDFRTAVTGTVRLELDRA